MPENDKKPAGWFSRRHQNRSAHEEARNHYLTTRGKAKRQGVAEAWDDEVVTGLCGHRHGKRQLEKCESLAS